MPAPSRDRLARPVDISTLLRGATRRVGLIVDEPGLTWAGLDGYRVRNTPGSGTGGSGSSGSVGRPVGVRAAGFGRGRNIQRPSITGRENRPPATTARRSGGRINGRSQLPSWYPRTPLGDITAITRAIERRRAELRQDQNTEAAHEENDAATAPSNAQLEPEIGSSTPIATFAVKPRTSPAIQIWKPESVDADWKTKNSGFLTPQKKLLNSIEKVREVWLEDQQKLKRTPAAKRAEREKKVETEGDFSKQRRTFLEFRWLPSLYPSSCRVMLVTVVTEREFVEQRQTLLDLMATKFVSEWEQTVMLVAVRTEGEVCMKLGSSD